MSAGKIQLTVNFSCGIKVLGMFVSRGDRQNRPIIEQLVQLQIQIRNYRLPRARLNLTVRLNIGVNPVQVKEQCRVC